MKSHVMTGLEKLKEEETTRGIPTLSRSVDDLLGGRGLKPGTMTELVGMPGVGKTTFCLQLCLNVQLPRKLQGHDGDAVYIGTNHSFSIFRLSQLTKDFVDRCNSIITTCKDLAPITVEETLKRIHVVKCCTIEELSRILISLEKFLKINPKVRLLILDGINFPMLTESDSFSCRVKVLYGLAQELLYPYIVKYKLAVIVTNSMTTRFAFSAGGTREYFVPYLGESWNYVPNQILKFSYDSKERCRRAELVKSAFCKTGTTKYRIIHGGFRD